MELAITLLCTIECQPHWAFSALRLIKDNGPYQPRMGHYPALVPLETQPHTHLLKWNLIILFPKFMFQLKILSNFISLTHLLSLRFYPSIRHLSPYWSLNFSSLVSSSGKQRKPNVPNTNMFTNKNKWAPRESYQNCFITEILQKDETKPWQIGRKP